nr:uncharacterized protein LOC114924008 [Arachis hypogaea]
MSKDKDFTNLSLTFKYLLDYQRSVTNGELQKKMNGEKKDYKLKLLLFSAILKSLTCTAVAISTCAAGSAAAVIPLFRLALPESSLVVIAARWLSSARQCLTSSLLCLSCLCCNPYCSLQSCLSLWLVQATAEAFRVADAPAKVFFLLMENTEEIFPFCAQIFQFQAQWLLVVAAE